MHKGPHSVQSTILFLVATICIVLDVGDAFNLFNSLPASYISLLLLFLQALMLSSLALLLNHLADLSKDIRKSAREDDIAYLRRSYMQVGENLRLVLGDDFFTELLSPLQIALKEQEVFFRESTQFRYYYVSTLENYASETFLCSTTLKTLSLWLDPGISTINANFIKNGGKIQQIVFVKSEDNLSSTEFQQFLANQQSIGVDVSIATMTVDLHALMFEFLRKNIIVGARTTIAWEVFIDENGAIGPSKLMINPSKIDDHRRVLKLAHQYRADI